MDKTECKNFLDNKLSNADTVLICSHKGPDDDSIGSVLTMKNYVENKGKTARVVYEGNSSDRWDMFKGFNDIEFKNNIEQDLLDAEFIIVLDGNILHRITDAKHIDIDDKVLVIDHHDNVEGSFSQGWVEPLRASTCDMLYELLYRDTDYDVGVGEAMLLGILGDTGGFNYVTANNTEVMVFASEIIKHCNIRVEEFQSRYRSTDIDSFNVYKKVLVNSQVYDIDGVPKFICSFVSEDDVKDSKDHFVSNACHMFVGFTKSLEGIGWNFVLSKRSSGLVAVSFRSIPGSVNVKALAESLGVGGGHENAAGGRFEDVTAQEALELVLTHLKQHGATLQDSS